MNDDQDDTPGDAADAVMTDVLFVSEHALWPLDQGLKVHGSNMLRGLERWGLHVLHSAIEPLPCGASPSLAAAGVDWPVASEADRAMFQRGWAGPLSKLRYRMASYQGRDLDRFAGVVSLVRRFRPGVVIGLGQHAPMMLQGLGALPADERPLRIWYAADEPVYFQLSLLRHDAWRDRPQRLRKAAVYAAMNRAFARGHDGAIGVSPLDARLLKWVAGSRAAVTIPNGVDLERFRPRVAPVTPRSLAFWGRMDFEPNIDAVTWFVRKIWPSVHRAFPDAVFRIAGKNPAQAVLDLSDVPGVEVLGEVDDVRPLAAESSVVVLPMRCGAGIKNKLLEAAAMGRPIFATPRAVRGLRFNTYQPPVHVCRRRGDWLTGLGLVWSDPNVSRRLGQAARAWVEQQHDWAGASRRLIRWFDHLSPSAAAWRRTPIDPAGRLGPDDLADKPDAASVARSGSAA